MNTPIKPLNRRRFLTRTSAAVAGTVAFLPAVRGLSSPGNAIKIGVIGTSRNSNGGDGRGTELAVDFSKLPGVEVAYVCDVDKRNVPKAIESVRSKGKQAYPPKGVEDFRRILEDDSVNAVVIATPNHWHAPAAILACAAGKHVYVEKPCSHNAHEGELLVRAARKHKRCVQHGTQRRSWPAIMEAMQGLREGRIGRVLFAKCYYFNPRPSIGQGREGAAPDWLNFDLWQGPAPERPYRDNLVHYNWHWFWHWGNAELGNNGVHFLDVCRWGMEVDYPVRVSASGGKYRYPDDDQETPDTNITSFDFGSATITWEQRSWIGRTPSDPKPDMVFYGDKGILSISGGGYTISDAAGAQVAQNSGPGGNKPHLQNFVDAIREAKPLNAEIEAGHKSALLCHLGNIAYRMGRTLSTDPQTGGILKDTEAKALWGREYRPGWEPKI